MNVGDPEDHRHDHERAKAASARRHRQRDRCDGHTPQRIGAKHGEPSRHPVDHRPADKDEHDGRHDASSQHVGQARGVVIDP